jgi:hypothetical protein
MKTTTTTPEQTTPDRTFRILSRIDQTGRGAICITERIKEKLESKEYQLATFPGYDGSIGVNFLQADGKSYDVCVQGKKSHCDCPWGTYSADKKPCRHLAAALKLQAMGELHLPFEQGQEDEESFEYEDCYSPADCY